MPFFDDYDMANAGPGTQGGPPDHIPLQNGMQDMGILPLQNSVVNQLDPNTPGSAAIRSRHRFPLDLLPAQKPTILVSGSMIQSYGWQSAGLRKSAVPRRNRQRTPQSLSFVDWWSGCAVVFTAV